LPSQDRFAMSASLRQSGKMKRRTVLRRPAKLIWCRWDAGAGIRGFTDQLVTILPCDKDGV
jgi:hypothetical protein